MKHLKENNETYFSHLKFAGTMGIQLFIRGIIFILHGIFPVCDVPHKLSLEKMYELVTKWHKYAQKRMQK